MRERISSRLWAVAEKELIHILRDPRSLTIIFILPLLMMIIFGYAIDMDLKEIRLAVVDYSRTFSSRRLLQSLNASRNFKICYWLESQKEIEPLIKARKIRAGLIIPRDFARKLREKTKIPVQLLVDGADANSASILINYLKAFLADYSLKPVERYFTPLLRVEPRIWYNPELKSANFVVPGLVAIFMMMICAMLTSITLAREKETGTLEQILVSPITRTELLVGKLLPYVLLSFLLTGVILGFSCLWFKVPFRGSILLLAFSSLFYIFSALSFGILISAVAPNQQMAMAISLVSTILPTIMLSGFIFPIPSMPKILQWLSYLIPARYFLIVIRGIMLKGVGMGAIYPQLIALSLLGLWFFLLSQRRFKLKLG